MRDIGASAANTGPVRPHIIAIIPANNAARMEHPLCPETLSGASNPGQPSTAISGDKWNFRRDALIAIL